MQYLLTEKEYTKLLDKHENEVEKKDEIILKLCRKIASELPLKVAWQEEKIPHGCVMNHRFQNEYKNEAEYCSGCPVEKICVYENKSWPK